MFPVNVDPILINPRLARGVSLGLVGNQTTFGEIHPLINAPGWTNMGYTFAACSSCNREQHTCKGMTSIALLALSRCQLCMVPRLERLHDKVPTDPIVNGPFGAWGTLQILFRLMRSRIVP